MPFLALFTKRRSRRFQTVTGTESDREHVYPKTNPRQKRYHNEMSEDKYFNILNWVTSVSRRHWIADWMIKWNIFVSSYDTIKLTDLGVSAKSVSAGRVTWRRRFNLFFISSTRTHTSRPLSSILFVFSMNTSMGDGDHINLFRKVKNYLRFHAVFMLHN